MLLRLATTVLNLHACMASCPSLRERLGNGIVKHLDDQCIGCNYCTMTCPYEVPRYHARLGIVRKCDLCSQRLHNGDAPACVQACPHEAIRITLIQRENLRQQNSLKSGALVPGAPANRLSLPTTQYLTKHTFAVDCGEAKDNEIGSNRSTYPWQSCLS